jgi:hypothetical protein
MLLIYAAILTVPQVGSLFHCSPDPVYKLLRLTPSGCLRSNLLRKSLRAPYGVDTGGFLRASLAPSPFKKTL